MSDDKRARVEYGRDLGEPYLRDLEALLDQYPYLRDFVYRILDVKSEEERDANLADLEKIVREELANRVPEDEVETSTTDCLRKLKPLLTQSVARNIKGLHTYNQEGQLRT